jgi:hypothetical protein
MSPTALPVAHRRRLRDLWRSAGWPSHDMVELDLVAAGLVLRVRDPQGRETLRVSDAGVQALALQRQRNQAALSAHEALVERVARDMQRAGRVVWRGLALRSPLTGDGAVADGVIGVGVAPVALGRTGPGLLGDTGAIARPGVRWVMAMPDVYSIRHTTREDCTEPIVHEIKVRRADLLADLRRPAKGAAYAALASQCWYVLAEGIADPDEVPACYGVMIARDGGLDVARAAPRRAMTLPFAVWMALARARAEEALGDDAQGLLGVDRACPGDDGVGAHGLAHAAAASGGA